MDVDYNFSQKYFQNPMVSKAFKKEAKANYAQPSKIEQAY